MTSRHLNVASASIDKALSWVQQSGPEGHDPYDALLCPTLATISQRSRLLGRLLIQLLRLSPINVRPLLGVRPDLDAKALGLLARAYFLLWDQSHDEKHLQDAVHCLSVLEGSVVTGFSGNCWGHPFPYQSSRSLLAANYPTVVSTVYAAQAFLDGYERGGEERWLEIARSAGHFIQIDLPRIGVPEKFCFSYYPGVRLPVHNASLLAAAFLARLSRLDADSTLLSQIEGAVRYTLDDQMPDGSWLYDGPESSVRERSFIDGFHTGFVLESLLDIVDSLGWDLGDVLERGLEFYSNHLFADNGQPYRQVKQRWPIDLRDCAQAIIVLSRFRDRYPDRTKHLKEVLSWTIANMQAPAGYFYYLRWGRFVTPVPYIRFQAWMLVALARYLRT